MFHDAPTQPHDDRRPAASEPALPTLQLPPVPFARPSAPLAAVPAPATAHVPAPVTPAESLPTGTPVQELLGALTAEPLRVAVDLDTAASGDLPIRPFEGFTAAVDRRGRRERRRVPRSTTDRRAFTSDHLAMPVNGPADPRPTTPPPVENVPERPAPIDPVMPALPIEPATAFELPTRGVAPSTQATVRPGVASTPRPAAPAGAAFPTLAAPQADAPSRMTLPVDAPSPVGEAADHSIAGIFDAPSAVRIGHLQPAHAATPATAAPLAGPAGPSTAPGAGLDPVAAAVATAPSAWYGGAVQVDDAMMVWNAPGAQAPVAPAVAAAIAPQRPQSVPPAPVAAAPAATDLATSPLAAGGPVAAASAPATAASRGPLASLLRLLLVIGIPAGAGVSIAIAIDRFAF